MVTSLLILPVTLTPGTNYFNRPVHLRSCCNQKERVQKSNNTCTLLCGPWCRCSPDRSHPYWHLNISKVRPCLPDLSDPQRFKDWQTQQHNNDTTHISRPILPHWCNLKKRSSCILFTEYTSPKVQAFLPANSQKRSLKVPRLLASSLSLSSIFLQQKLNYPSDAAEDH